MLKSNKQSDKLNLIDRDEFEKIQQQTDAGSTASGLHKPIRNTKYKKTRTTFNLLNFLTQKPKKVPGERHKMKTKKCVVGTRLAQPMKKRGKTREGGRKKYYSRLKKSILRYRQLKREEESIDKATVNLAAMTVTEPCKLTQEQQTHNMSKFVQLKREEECIDEATINLAALTLVTQPSKPIKNVHSRRFRDYCDNCTTPRLLQLTEQLLRELDRFQKRAYMLNEIKACAHRRFVIGFREMQNYLRINKVKLAIIAPDCEPALNETIEKLKSDCQAQQIPYLFAQSRRHIAYALYKKAPIGCAAILDYDGARELFNQILEALQEARQSYAHLTAMQGGN